MADNSVQEHVQELEARLRRLERGASGQSTSFWQRCKDTFGLDEDQAANRMIGWGILALTAVALINNIQNQSVLFLLVITGSIGVWLILQASGIIDESDSVRQLATESRAERAVPAGRTHHTVRLEKRVNTTQRLQWIALLAGVFIGVTAVTYAVASIGQDKHSELLLILVIFAGIAVEVTRREYSRLLQYLLVIGCAVLLLLLPSTPSTLALTLFLTGIALWYAFEKHDVPLRLGVIGGALYLTQVWLVPQGLDQNITAELVRQIAGIILSALALLPYVQRRRTLGERDTSRISLALGACGLLFTLVSSALSLLDYGWALALLTTGLVLAGLGYFAWIAHERLSYAKYFFTLALAAGAGFVLLAFDAPTITLMLFMAGMVVSMIGFVLPSYSARLLGVGLLGLAVLTYLLLLVPAPLQYSGSIFLRERVWMGMLLAVFLPLLAHWYKIAHMRGMELLLVPTLIVCAYVSSFFILFGIIYLDIPSVDQGVLWLLLGAGSVIVGIHLRKTLLKVLGVGLGFAAFLKLLFTDSLQMSAPERILVFILIAAALISIGTTSSWQLPKIHNHN